MVITYTKSYNEVCEGINWTLYQDIKLKDSLIIWKLFNFVKSNKEMLFEDLYAAVKFEYQTKTVKSRCVIEKDGQNINILVKGVFPRFYIQKNPTKNH